MPNKSTKGRQKHHRHNVFQPAVSEDTGSSIRYIPSLNKNRSGLSHAEQQLIYPLAVDRCHWI
jgi:hypothetical protein